jgi:tRNA pseudouridine38-40 synthase
MVRYKITLEYDGNDYLGWQIQQEHNTIQGEVQSAIYKYCQELVLVYGSGRTDAGVHAEAQVAHFDLGQEKNPLTIKKALNFYLQGKGISILMVEQVDENFHARFSAIERSYRYDIINRASPPALRAKYLWFIRQQLLIDDMEKAARLLEGTHDFSSFRSSECQSKSAIKTLDRILIIKQGDIISIHFHARSFLHNQVRIMVGTLVEVGLGKIKPVEIDEILTARNRNKSGITAPAQGLFFIGPRYN